MRSYGQFCALARALDVVGDRWTLLILRELFARDGRYSDLRDALPGIASNLLADRLRQLKVDGLIDAYDAPPPVRATVYRLTPRGRELAPALRALVAWGAPLLLRGPADDAFRTHWLALALRILFDGIEVADLAPLTILVKTGGEPVTVDLTGDGVAWRFGVPASEEAIVIEGEPESVFALLSGTAGIGTPDGVRIRGPRGAVRRLHALAARCRVGTSQTQARA